METRREMEIMLPLRRLTVGESPVARVLFLEPFQGTTFLLGFLSTTIFNLVVTHTETLGTSLSFYDYLGAVKPDVLKGHNDGEVGFLSKMTIKDTFDLLNFLINLSAYWFLQISTTLSASFCRILERNCRLPFLGRLLGEKHYGSQHQKQPEPHFPGWCLVERDERGFWRGWRSICTCSSHFLARHHFRVGYRRDTQPGLCLLPIQQVVSLGTLWKHFSNCILTNRGGLCSKDTDSVEYHCRSPTFKLPFRTLLSPLCCLKAFSRE